MPIVGDPNVTTRIELRTVATTHGAGPFHPAIRDLARVMYWPNITFDTEDEAYLWAGMEIAEVQRAVDDITDNWNVWKA